MNPRALADANRARRDDAARRDCQLARAIITTPEVWAWLDATQRRITEARAAYPYETWAQIGARLAIGKNAAYHTWRRMLAYPQLTRLKEARCITLTLTAAARPPRPSSSGPT